MIKQTMQKINKEVEKLKNIYNKPYVHIDMELDLTGRELENNLKNQYK